jgi:hypothetical protein
MQKSMKQSKIEIEALKRGDCNSSKKEMIFINWPKHP